MDHTFDWLYCPAVEWHPDRVSGAWVFRGTRVPVAALFENLEAGASLTDIVEWFPGITLDQLRTVLDHAERNSMAQVVRMPKLEKFVTKDLENLLAFWRTVPEMAAEWPEWDEMSRSDFVIQWPIERAALSRLKKAAKAGMLDERQQRDWQELQQLIETHRATVEQMLEGPI